ncbi:hypothetical protein K1T71_011069 [Dendrolimus kikuchii]|uniref:Uncharacterized protein n=1 Tax=Dendrolimus kikuchii TaxID=765133 RepID=A0ACC1CMR5_9NEOP|nr:hypothetical protein K1T71_011069 [Dendrolimus kikuchii]
MPPTKDFNTKNTYSRSFSNNEMTMSAKVYHPATNLLPPSPPLSPTGISPAFPTRSTSNPGSWSRQNSHTGKYS